MTYRTFLRAAVAHLPHLGRSTPLAASACRLNLRWLPSQLKRLQKLRSLRVSAAKLNLATLFKGMGSMGGLRDALFNMVGVDKKTAEQGLPDGIMAPLACNTGQANWPASATAQTHAAGLQTAALLPHSIWC